MSGPDIIVGLVFGALPLIFKAVEGYEKINDVIATYRKYSDEVERFGTELSTQKVIFHNQCKLLLREIVDDQRLLHEIFSHPVSGGGPKHKIYQSLKNDENLDRKLFERINGGINNSYEELVELLRLIDQDLQEIYEETKYLLCRLSSHRKCPALPIVVVRLDAENGFSVSQKDSNSFKKWKRSVRKKFRFSFGKKVLQEKISRLGNYNRNFLAMSGQMSQLKDFRSLSEHEKDVDRVEKGLEEVCEIRKASQRLCSALNSLWLCQDHAAHSANLRLSLDLGTSAPIPRSKIGFNVMIANWTVDSSDGLEKPVELFIESSVEEIPEHADPSEEVQGSSNPLQPQSPQNLCTDSTSLCRQFSRQLEPTTALTCLGHIPGFVVYRSQQKTQEFSGAIPITRVLSNRDGDRKMNILGKWKLAGVLATAVFHYHSTPWLRETWMDKDILFFETQPVGRLRSLESPHLHLFQQPNDDTRNLTLAIYDDPFIKNKILFQLGMLLLELEFEESLDVLTEKWNTIFPKVQDSGESLTRRLLVPKYHAGENLGPKYGRIVRMCLDCDFGLGIPAYSLNDRSVQEAFYLQIICQFKELLPKWETLFGTKSP